MKKTFVRRIRPRRRKRAPLASGKRIDYKDVGLLRRFISEQGKILPRRVNRVTAKQQRSITRTIKSARILAMLHFLNNDH